MTEEKKRYIGEMIECPVPVEELNEKLRRAYNPFNGVVFTHEEAEYLGAFEETAFIDEYGNFMCEEEILENVSLRYCTTPDEK